jgi:acetylornithine deacetylase/succinyl-diaminopimelate desuccinylase-like protein
MRRILLLVLAAITAACRDAPAPTRAFDAEAAFAAAERQVAFGPRIPGTEGHAAMAGWLDSVLRARADSVVLQRWTHVTQRGDTLQLVNLFASFNPSATERLLFLAHWDTRPRSDGPAAAPTDSATPVPGANDGASGVAVLLGVANALQATPPSIGVDLLFVDGEDYGDFFTEGRPDVLIGSRYYAANQLAPAPLYAVLFDMVGDRDLRISREGNSVIGAPEVVDLVWKVAAEAGHASVFVPYEGTTVTDDHIELQQVGIRAIDVIDFSYGPGNAWWHSSEDTMDKISAESLGIVGDVALRLVQAAEGQR